MFGARIGEGASGDVRAATDPTLRRTVAVKVLREPSPAAEARFVSEAQVTAQLEHPNIVPVHALGVTPDGHPYLAMKLVQGRSLAEAIAAGGLPRVEDRIDVVRKLCDAIAFAHAQGVLHRDLKPENVMVGAFGEVVLMDWGLARPIVGGEAQVTVDRFDGDAFRTREGQIAGTPAYMAPEQARGELGRLDARTDVYGLGAVLFFVLTGRAPAEGSARAALDAVRAGRVPTVRQLAPRAPAELDRVVRRALAFEPGDRYPSAAALREDLDAWLAHRPLPGVGSGIVDRVRKWSTRNRGAVAVGVALAGASLAALAAVSTGYARAVASARDLAVAESVRARRAEDAAEINLAHTRIALADAEEAVGAYGRARAHLEAAAAALRARGADPREADIALALLSQISPPPATTCAPDGPLLALSLRGAEVDTISPRGWARWRADDCAPIAATALAGATSAAIAGRYGLVVAGDEAVHLLDGQIVARQAVPAGTRVSVHPSGFALLWGDTDRLVRVGETAVLRETPRRGVTPRPAVDGAWLLAGAVVGGPPGGLWDASGALRWSTLADMVAVADAGDVAIAGGDDGVVAERLDGRAGWATQGSPPRFVGIVDRRAWVVGFGDLLDLLDLDDGHRVRRLVIAPDSNRVAVDGPRVAVAGPSGVAVWRLGADDRTVLRADGDANGLDVLGEDVFLGVDDGVIRLRDGAEVERWRGLGDRIRSVSASDRGVLVAARDGGVHLLVSGRATPAWSAALGARALHAAWQGEVAVAVDAAGRVHRFDVAGRPLGAVQVQPGASWDVTPIPGAPLVVVAGNDLARSEVRVVDPTTGAVRATLPARHTRYHHAVSPDGRWIAVATHDGTVTVWDWRTGATRALATDAGPTLAVAFSPDGALLATGGYDQRVRLFDPASGEALRSVAVPGPVVTLTFREGKIYALSGDFTLSMLRIR